MALAIVLTTSANADLLEIWEFIAADNPGQADALIGLIDAKLQNLCRQAGLGRMRDELAPGLGSFPARRCVISSSLIQAAFGSCVACMAARC